jgi:hypothetical protein
MESLTIDNTNLECVLDPLEKTRYDKEGVMAACGLIPFWFVEYASTPKPETGIKEYMSDRYGFGALFPMTIAKEPGDQGSTIHEDGSMTYPGDPELYPLMRLKAKHTDAELIQWDMGIVAMRDKPTDEWFLTRMD